MRSLAARVVAILAISAGISLAASTTASAAPAASSVPQVSVQQAHTVAPLARDWWW
ncbi:MAG: hypothetical protein ACR2LX_17800 [Jatrophihabitans sp.]